MRPVLVINSGSSSFKYQLLDVDTTRVLATGLVERIGLGLGQITHDTLGVKTERTAHFDNHTVGFEAMLEAFKEQGPDLEKFAPIAVGHRVVQGGSRFFEPTIIDDVVEINIEELSQLAPLHNPGALQGIRAARKIFTRVKHVAVFDTAFHQTMPPASYTYAIDTEVAKQYRIRRYGFHGTSHSYVAKKTAEFLGKPLNDLNMIVLHLGNGASACAIRGGKSVNTSMGMTPLEGLVMGTRSGDIDPAILFYLNRVAGYDVDALDRLLNTKSGLLGLAGSNDMRDVAGRAETGDEKARLAIEVYALRIRHYVGAYYAELGRLDAIAFTAGVGENSDTLRLATLENLESIGIQIDNERNSARSRSSRLISTDSSKVRVLVVPTNEELEIAVQAAEAAE
ncbi:MAG: acetate kinase [Microbacteriaceae bacterium]|nr:acetate kinase [Microbacteriaceae bacterium]